MRVMLMSTPFPSHFSPTIPLAWALRAAGHEVLVAAQPDVVDAANAAGLCGAEIGDRFHGIDNLMAMLPDGKRPGHLAAPSPAAQRQNASLWFTHAGYLLPRYVEFARWFRPDLVVSEQLEFAGPVVAAVVGVPSVRQRWGLDPLGAVIGDIARFALRATCRRWGLDGLPDPTVLLDPCPPDLQVPGAAPARPIRYVPVNGGAPVPDWITDRRADRRVCVSIGRHTPRLNGIGLLRSLCAAFRGMSGVEAVVTVEPDVAAQLGPVPGNVRLVAPTPLTLFLDTCAAVLHHGGSNTAMTATLAGCPQVVVPQVADEYGTADRLTELGIAATVPDAAEQDDPERVRAALDQVLGDPEATVAARRAGRAMAALPSPAAVVPELVALTA